MSGHSAENDARIDAAAEALGVTLVPWQREYLHAMLSGERFVMHRGRRGGWTTVQRVAECVTSPERTRP